MMRLVQAFLALIGLAPSGEGEQAKTKYIIAWAKGAVFGLALLVSITVLASSLIWLIQVIAPAAIAATVAAA
jgi:hypothetical protein